MDRLGVNDIFLEVFDRRLLNSLGADGYISMFVMLHYVLLVVMDLFGILDKINCRMQVEM